MLSEKEKKEMLEDAYNHRIRGAFKEVDRKYIEWLKAHPGYRSLDNYITFLNSIQKIFGPLPISKKTTLLPHKSYFRFY